MTDIRNILTSVSQNIREFDAKGIEKDIQKHVRTTFKSQAGPNFLQFCERLKSKDLVAFAIGILTDADLKKIVKAVDKNWLKPTATAEEIRSRLIDLISHRSKPLEDFSQQAKKFVPGLKTAKTLPELRQQYGQIEDVEIAKIAIRLVTGKKTLLRRLDKFNADISEMTDDEMTELLAMLAEGAREPRRKTLASAAAKARWSGSEPD